MARQSKLEQIGIEKRNDLIGGNTYNSVSPSNKYSATHTRALSDTKTPIQGKGTGVFLEDTTTKGGGDYDINGNPEYPGSGRIKNKAINEYNDIAVYTTPNMTLNAGQIEI